MKKGFGLRGKELIIFDLDGTLIDSAPDLASAVNKMLESLGRDGFDESVVRGWVGNGARVLVKRALTGGKDGVAVDEKLYDCALEVFMKLYSEKLCEKTSLYEGVKETLSELKNSYTLAIATNKPSAFVAPILEKLDIAHLFSMSVGGDDLPKKKPHPMQLEYVCERLGIPKERSLMVGDSKNDILAAIAAGIQSIGVSYGYNYSEDIKKSGPDFVVDRFVDILEVLDGLR